MSTPTFPLSTPVDNSEATWKKATKCNKNYMFQSLFFFRSFKARSLQRQCMFEASDRMNHLKKPKPRGQTLPPHAYNMDFSSSMRSNLSNFNSPQHLDDKIEEDQEDPNAGIELLERSDITNDEPVVEGKL